MNHECQVFEGPGVVAFQCVAVAVALELYARTGIKAARAYTPGAMLATAARLTGEQFKRGQYAQAAAALRARAASIRAAA